MGNQSFKVYYDDANLLLEDLKNWEVRCGANKSQADQNIKKLIEVWKAVDPKMSLDPNMLNDVNNTDNRYLLLYI